MSLGLFEDGREAGLELVTSCADAYYRVKRSCYDDGEYSERDCDDRGDFLYDYARMSLQYVNELARLGSAYAVLPARMLERLCTATLGPPARTRRRNEIVRCAAPKEPVKYTMKLRNTCSTPQVVRVLVSSFKDRNDNPLGGTTVIKVAGSPYTPGDALTLPAGESRDLSVELEVPEKAKAKRIYRSRITAAFEESGPRTVLLGLEVEP